MNFADALEDIKRYSHLAHEKDQTTLKDVAIEEFKLADETRDLVAIDGSHSFILDLAGIKLAVIRVCALEYTFVVGTKTGFKLKNSSIVERPIVISAHEEFVEGQSELYKSIFEHARRSKLNTYSYMANELRRFEEYKLLNQVSGNTSGELLALDGALTIPPPFLSEFSDMMEDTIQRCKDHENVLIGVSKDSETHAFGSPSTDEELLLKVEKQGYLYVKANLEGTYIRYGDVYFARLHPMAMKWFRIDIETKERPERVFPLLAHYARSELCPGYIYPLLEAHRLAVMVRRLHDIYEKSIIALAPKYGISLGEILRGRTDIEGSKMRMFHEFLDRVSR
ncbi:MAG: DNA double-strand break repair nuclease NurA [Methanocellales archaeon]|nr:DNA double-strand break repair nuclease NurA [Methanocellales archaeon]MDD3291209.1 DNA double-strand break repair nuclease NurA [Methanocellales archaeon]MDD5235309.1 DNA double-strand break repair nuclease NurA [Methanocellales archaeon]MDD5484535.1 DNA double-strand break repair nuclease NurA [Methanocellales archaeon]